MKRAHHTEYDEETTARCERALVTLLGDLGFWRERIYLAGGLTPRYLIGQLPEGARAHVGTTDIDLVVGIALGDETPETYWTLQNNLEKSGFKRTEPSYRWVRDVDGVTVKVEFSARPMACPLETSSTRKVNKQAPSSPRSTSEVPSSHATTSSNARSRPTASKGIVTEACARSS